MRVDIRLQERFTQENAVNALRILTAELGGQLPLVSGYINRYLDIALERMRRAR